MSANSFRYIGITDETTVCEHCGRADLRSTVVLALLDADGSDEEYVRYGSTCAAKALSIAGGGRQVAKAAEIQRHLTFEKAREARTTLARYAGDEAAALVVFRADTGMEGSDGFVVRRMRRRIAEAQAAVRDAELLRAR
jgi:hypothetical protein